LTPTTPIREGLSPEIAILKRPSIATCAPKARDSGGVHVSRPCRAILVDAADVLLDTTGVPANKKVLPASALSDGAFEAVAKAAGQIPS
jgi:hypothetical protein